MPRPIAASILVLLLLLSGCLTTTPPETGASEPSPIGGADAPAAPRPAAENASEEQPAARWPTTLTAYAIVPTCADLAPRCAVSFSLGGTGGAFRVLPNGSQIVRILMTWTPTAEASRELGLDVHTKTSIDAGEFLATAEGPSPIEIVAEFPVGERVYLSARARGDLGVVVDQDLLLEVWGRIYPEG